jgi:charged multivesicular body protein 2B
MRKQNQDLRKAQRDIDRTKRDLDKQEKQLEMEIRKAAKSGQTSVCTTYAKQLVQLRKQKARLTTAGSQIGAVSSQAKVMQANNTLASAVASSSRTMAAVNRQMDPAVIAKSMRDFEQENAKMDMKGEVMDDALSSVLDHSDDEAEQDAVVTQVLDEIGIDITGKLAAAPAARRTGLELPATSRKLTDHELEAQLARLKM